jgi:hypothetical protein
MIKQRSFVLAAALGAALFSSPAWAGECPAGQLASTSPSPPQTRPRG